MAKAKKKAAKKRAPKKATKRAATKAPTKRRAKVKPDDHIKRASRAVLRVLDEVTATDAAGIARLRRLVDHAHENAKSRRP